MTVTIERRRAEIRELARELALVRLRAERRELRAKAKILKAEIRLKRKKIQTVREICEGYI